MDFYEFQAGQSETLSHNHTTQPPNSPKQNNNKQQKEDSDSVYPLLESAVLETELGAWHMRGHGLSR